MNKDSDIQNEVNKTYKNLIAQTDAKLLGEKFDNLSCLFFKPQERRMGYKNEEPHVDFYPIPIIVAAALEATAIETISRHVELSDILDICLKQSESVNQKLVTLMPLINRTDFDDGIKS